MRKIRTSCLVIGALAILALSCTRTEKANLSGTVKDGADQMLSLERLDVNRTVLVDSVKIDSREHFSLKVELEEGELFILKDGNGNIINLLISPEDKLEIKTSLASFGNEYSIKGSEESENIRKLVVQLDQTRMIMDSLQNLAAAIPDPESDEMKELSRAFSDALVHQKRYSIRYLVENMGKLSSVYALYQKYDEESMVLGLETDLPYFSTVADSLEVTHPGSSLTSSLRADIITRENSFRKNQQINKLLEMAEENTGYLKLNIADRNGTEISLSSLEGKVILLVFWSSGSKASISALLGLKSTYDAYHAKGFEVYAVGLESNKASWMQAMDFNEFNWINVSELNFPESESALKYNVQSMPASFLINREGSIMARNLWGRQLETWLDNLL